MGYLNDPVDKYADRKQMVSDIQALRELAEEQALQPDEPPGPLEVELDSKFREQLEEMAADRERQSEEILAEMQGARVEQEIAFVQAQESAAQTRIVLENMHEVGVANLFLTGVTAAAMVAGVNRLEEMQGALDDTNEWLDGIDDRLRDLQEEVSQQGVWAREELIAQGEATRRELRLSSNRIVQVLGACIMRSTRDVVVAQHEAAQRLEQAAHLRHQELTKAIHSPLRIRADEYYNQAHTHFECEEYASTIRRLRLAFSEDSTHVLSWILLARVLVKRGMPGRAKAAYRRAANYAKGHTNVEAYVSAMIRWSHIERLVGNYRHAYSLLLEVQSTIGSDSPHAPQLAVERQLALKALCMHSDEQAGDDLPADMAKRVFHDLRQLFKTHPQLRDQVATSPLFVHVRRLIPSLSVGQAPYASLNEAVDYICTVPRFSFKRVETDHGRHQAKRRLHELLDGLKKVFLRTDCGRKTITEREQLLVALVEDKMNDLCDNLLNPDESEDHVMHTWLHGWRKWLTYAALHEYLVDWHYQHSTEEFLDEKTFRYVLEELNDCGHWSWFIGGIGQSMAGAKTSPIFSQYRASYVRMRQEQEEV